MGSEDNHIIIDCKGVHGSLDIAKSKSVLHRYIVCSYLSGDIDRIKGIEDVAGELSDDVKATKECLIALSREDNPLKLMCRESGTTMRFMIPLVATLGVASELILEGSLIGRPLSGLIEELRSKGIEIATEIEKEVETEREQKIAEVSTIRVSGKLKSGDFYIPGNISSQYISGLMLALPTLAGDSRIITDSKPKSEPYIDLTRNIMEKFGVHIEREDLTETKDFKETDELKIGIVYSISGGQKYSFQNNPETILEGDWSAAAMWLVLNEINDKKIEIKGLREDSFQGDSMIVDILNKFRKKDINSHSGRFEFDMRNYPDIVPAVVLRAALEDEDTETVISEVGALRYKECDRLEAVKDILSNLGARIRIEGDTLVVRGSGKLLRGTDEIINVRNDHRMAMLAGIASAFTEKPVRINNAACAKKSYPGFWDDIRKLGGRVDKI